MKSMSSVFNAIMIVVSVVMGVVFAVAGSKVAAASGASIVLMVLILASMGAFLDGCYHLK